MTSSWGSCILQPFPSQENRLHSDLGWEMREKGSGNSPVLSQALASNTRLFLISYVLIPERPESALERPNRRLGGLKVCFIWVVSLQRGSPVGESHTHA